MSSSSQQVFLSHQNSEMGLMLDDICKTSSTVSFCRKLYSLFYCIYPNSFIVTHTKRQYGIAVVII